MIPITQTKMVVKNSKGEMVVRGNCYPAVIASIMELPITEVPNVETLYHIEGTYWAIVMQMFIESKGWELMTDDRFKVYHDEDWIRRQPEYTTDGFRFANSLRWKLKEMYYMVSGQSARGVMHVCIFKNGEIVHDPHPSRDGLLTYEYFETLEKKIDPNFTKAQIESLMHPEMPETISKPINYSDPIWNTPFKD